MFTYTSLDGTLAVKAKGTRMQVIDYSSDTRHMIDNTIGMITDDSGIDLIPHSLQWEEVIIDLVETGDILLYVIDPTKELAA
jgi:hypothetical protein